MSFPRPRALAGVLRPVWLVAVAALPFACTAYGPDLLGSAPGQAGTGGDSPARAGGTAGDAPDDGSVSGGGGAGHAGGAIGKGGSTGGGAPGIGGASTGGATAIDSTGEGGVGTEPSSGGSSAGTGGVGKGGAATAAAGTGGANSAGASVGGAGAGGSGTGGTSAMLGLVAAYPCESANGAVLSDTSGNGKNATLANGAGGGSAGFSFGAGVIGNALTLSASNQAYVSLPKGIAAQLTEATIATWVKLKSNAAFQRIFDFGIDTSTFMYLVNAGSAGTVRFRIVSAPLNKNQILEGTDALPVGKWIHVAVTIGEGGISIYLDGAQTAQKAPAALRPSDLGETSNNFIGRSPFSADPYLDGQIDEFHIYNRVLSAAEIEVLAGH